MDKRHKKIEQAAKESPSVGETELKAIEEAMRFGASEFADECQKRGWSILISISCEPPNCRMIGAAALGGDIACLKRGLGKLALELSAAQTMVVPHEAPKDSTTPLMLTLEEMEL